MIPDHVKEFISIPGMAQTASRDARLQPSLTRGFGVKVHPDQKTVTYYIAELGSEQIIADFENNGRVALTIWNILMDFNCYQLKGKFVSWRRNNEQDDQFLDEYQTQIYEKVTKLGIPEETVAQWNLWISKPCIAITFEVDSVFIQTPHPEAGKLISGEKPA